MLRMSQFSASLYLYYDYTILSCLVDRAFLKTLCLTLNAHFLQTLNLQTEGVKKNLTFVPLAPACVVSIHDFQMIIQSLVFWHPIQRLCTFSFYYLFSGYSSANPSICCKPSSKSSSMEIFLDYTLFSNDLCYAHKPQSSHGHGPTETRHLVY